MDTNKALKADVDVPSRQLIGGTLASDVLHRLREDIVSGVLPPDSRLRFDMLRSVYGASFSTMREGLSALATEGLVEGGGQKGFKVAQISRAALLDLTNARVLIEREALRLSLLHGDDNWEAHILAAYHRLDRAVQRHEENYGNRDWARLHREFHESFVAACGSPILLSIRSNLFERAHRYRCIASALPNSPRDKNEEHRELTEAAIQRNLAAVQEITERHIRGTTEKVLKVLQLP